MPSETPRHLELKRFALTWAQLHGYRAVAAEVSVPNLGARLDVAAYRPARARSGTAAVTAVFECKQCRSDLAKLHERRALYEESMRVHMPSLRNGDALFPEYDSYRFTAPGFEPYDKLMRELRLLSARLHGQTKFDQLVRWRAANLHYVVIEEGVAKAHEAPPGWGLLVRAEDELRVACEPTWQDAPEERRAELLLRIALAGTKPVNQRLGVVLPVRA